MKTKNCAGLSILDSYRGFLFGILSMFLCLHAVSAATFQGVGDLSGRRFESFEGSVSADGRTVVGYGRFAGSSFEAFRWTAETGLESLANVGRRPLTFAWDVAADGNIVVGRTSSGGGTVLDVAAASNLFVSAGEFLAVSDEGTAGAGHQPASGGAREAYRWTEGAGSNGLGNPLHDGSSFGWAISGDGSVVVGYACDPCEAYRWTEETGMVGMGEFDNAEVGDSRGYGVSADGSVVVGRGFNADGILEAFRWNADDGMQGLGFLPDEGMHDSVATAASSDGSVIVGIIGNDFSGQWDGPFIWNARQGMKRLDQVLADGYGLGNQLAGWTLVTADDVSADGLTFVGQGINPGGDPEVWVATISEPVGDPDLNIDGFVDGLDLGILLGNFDQSGIPASGGELNGTDPVDGLDLGIMLGAWNPERLSPVATVPEPSTTVLLAGLAAIGLFARRARCFA